MNWIQEFKQKLKMQDEIEYQRICNIRERNGRLWIMVGDCAIAELRPEMTIAEVIEQLNTTRQARYDYKQL